MYALSKPIITFILALMINLSAHAVDTPDKLIDDPANPIRLFAIFHDDVPAAKRSSTYVDHIRPFTTEFENITGRKIHVIFDRNRPPFTNFNYKSADQNNMFQGWKKLAWEYRTLRHERNEFPFSSNDRILLITNDFINGGPVFGGVGGIANQSGSAAIASLDFKQVIGHELGHSFNAIHEEGEVLYNGWWCETFMFEPLPLRSNCFVFSEGNRKRIKAYVDSRY